MISHLQVADIRFRSTNIESSNGGYVFGMFVIWDNRRINTLRPRQNGRHFADDTFKRIILNNTFRISIRFLLKIVPRAPINMFQ